MKTPALVIILIGLLANSGARAQSSGGATVGAAASGGGARVSGGTFRGQAAVAARPAAPGNLTAQPQNVAMPQSQQVQPQLQQGQQPQQLLEQQQALRQQQLQQAAAGVQQGAAPGSQQGSQIQSTLVPNGGAQIGQAAQPPQVGVATGLSAAPNGQAAQAPSPGVVPQNANGTASTGVASTTSDLGIQQGAVGNLPINGVGGVGAIVPATAGTLVGIPTGLAGAPVLSNPNIQTNPAAAKNPAAANLAVQPGANGFRPAVVPVERPAKPALAVADLPDAVRKVLKDELGEGSLYSLERTSGTRGAGYKAAFKNNNKYREIQIAEDGTLISDSRDSTPAVIAATAKPIVQNTKVSELPQAVLNAVKAYGSADEIQNIELAPSGNRSVYNIQVRHGEKLTQLQVAKDGSVIRNSEVDSFATPGAESLVSADGSLAPGNVSGHPVPVPLAVRNTIEAQGGGTQVKDVQLDTVNGRPVYDVDTVKNGARARLQIGEDGKIVDGQGLAVSVSELPDKVQSKVKSEVGGAIISGIQKEARNGKTVYDVRYGSSTGKDTHLFLAEDGTVMPTKASLTAAGAPASAASSRLQLADLPQAAQQAIKDNIGQGSVDGLTVRTSKGQNIYSAKFTKDGVSDVVDVDENGTILNSK